MKLLLKIILCWISLITLALAEDPTKAYLMSFHIAPPDARGPRDHSIYLTESDDAINWTLVPGFRPYKGSVPDVITRDHILYIYTPGFLKTYDTIKNKWSSKRKVSVSNTNKKSISFVDPSLILDTDNQLVLFFLNSTGLKNQDPARCKSYPCTKYIDSAVETQQGVKFTLQTGHRLAITLEADDVAASDPDIFFDGTQYILLFAFNGGVKAYASTTLHGSYEALSTLSEGELTTVGGSVPAGHYDSASAQYWIYVHTSNNTTTVIRRAVTDLSTVLVDADFSSIITAAQFGFDADYAAESPGFTVNTLE